MKYRHSLLAVLAFISILDCKDVPTFDASVNDPDSEDYLVRPIKEFKVIRNNSSKEAYFYLNYPSKFPITGFEVEVRDETESSEFEPFITYETPSAIGDSTYYLIIPEVPFIMNEFRIRPFYESENHGVLYSDYQTATLRQFLYFNLGYTFAEDSVVVEFTHTFLNDFQLTLFNQTANEEKKVVLKKVISTNQSFSAEFSGQEILSSALSYTISSPSDSIGANSLHAFSLEYTPGECITKIDDYILFTPESINYSKRWYEQNVTISWEEQCDINEYIVYQDDRGSVIEPNQAYPLVEVGRYYTPDGTGNSTVYLEDNYHQDLYQIWIIANHNGTLTEFTTPYLLSY